MKEDSNGYICVILKTDKDGKKKDTNKYVLKRDRKEVGAGEIS